MKKFFHISIITILMFITLFVNYNSYLIEISIFPLIMTTFSCILLAGLSFYNLEEMNKNKTSLDFFKDQRDYFDKEIHPFLQDEDKLRRSKEGLEIDINIFDSLHRSCITNYCLSLMFLSLNTIFSCLLGIFQC